MEQIYLYPKLRSALGKSNYEWLLEDNEEVAFALAEEVAAGGDPEAIARCVSQELGETREGRVNRIRSAAKYLQGLKK
jgi:hypothetical protein